MIKSVSTFSTNPEYLQPKADDKKGTFGNENYFTFGAANKFPQNLAWLNRTTPDHSGILSNKVTLGSGKTITGENDSQTEYIKSVNNLGQSLHSVANRYFVDRFGGGNNFIQVVTNAQRNFINIYSTDWTTCRVGCDDDGNPNGNIVVGNFSTLDTFNNTNKLKEIALYPNFTKIGGNLHTMVHIKDYVPDFPIYGLPNWAAALKNAEIIQRVINWNNNRVKNSFSASGVYSDEFKDLEQAKKAQDLLKEKNQGDDNSGKVVFLPKGIGGGAGAFTSFTDNKEGEWLQLQVKSEDNLYTTHAWRRSLVGATEKAGFDVNRILSDFDYVLSTVVEQEQQTFIDIITKLYGEIANIDLSGISFLNTAPVKDRGVEQYKGAYKIWEVRKMQGSEYDEADIDQQQWYTGQAPANTTIKTEEV